MSKEEFAVTAEDLAEISSGGRGALQPGETATVFVGTNPRTFRIGLSGTINNAKLAIFLQGKQAAVLTQSNSNTVVEGTEITVQNQGSRAQFFISSPV